MAANMWKNSLKNVESDNNKILYENLLKFFSQRNHIYFLNNYRTTETKKYDTVDTGYYNAVDYVRTSYRHPSIPPPPPPVSAALCRHLETWARFQVIPYPIFGGQDIVLVLLFLLLVSFFQVSQCPEGSKKLRFPDYVIMAQLESMSNLKTL